MQRVRGLGDPYAAKTAYELESRRAEELALTAAGASGPDLHAEHRHLAAAAAARDRRNRIGRPDDNRRLIADWNVGSASSTSSNSVWAEMMATIVAISRTAKWFPTHMRGPLPNGKYACRGMLAARSTSKRDGSNCAGSGKKRASRCVTHELNTTTVPASILCPSSSTGLVAGVARTGHTRTNTS